MGGVCHSLSGNAGRTVVIVKEQENERTNVHRIGPGKRRDHAGGSPTLNASHEQPILLGSKKQHSGVTQDGISTTLTSQEKERPIVGGGEAMKSVVRRLTPLE